MKYFSLFSFLVPTNSNPHLSRKFLYSMNSFIFSMSEMIKTINSYNYVVRTNTHVILNIIKENTSLSDLLENENK